MLTRHSSVFQIIPWNWKHLANHKVQGRKVFWHVTLHSYLCNSLCKFFIKIKLKCFSKTYSRIESTWSINASKEEIILLRDSKELFVQRFLKVFDQNWKREIKEEAPQLTLLYRGRAVRSSHRRCRIRKLFLKVLQYPQETPVLESIF